jgi:hypothetical protein
MIEIVELMISCMKGQGTYTRFKVKYSKKETLCNTTLRGEENSIRTLDTEDEDEEEVWAKAKEK